MTTDNRPQFSNPSLPPDLSPEVREMLAKMREEGEGWEVQPSHREKRKPRHGKVALRDLPLA